MEIYRLSGSVLDGNQHLPSTHDEMNWEFVLLSQSFLADDQDALL